MQPEAFRHRMFGDEDRPKQRTEGLPDELVRPPKDYGAIQAAEAFYRKKQLEASGKAPTSNLSKAQ